VTDRLASMYRLLYNILLHTVVGPILTLAYLPPILLKNKYQRSIRGKLGRLPADLAAEGLARPRLWFHAVSVGEVVALNPLVEAMKALVPEAAILVSTGTETGQDKARELIRHADGFFYLPLDFPEFIGRVVERIRPDLFVLMETELWPNLVHSLKSAGATIALANGRISDRSFPRYRRLRWFFAPVLKEMDVLLMSSELDAQRIEEMGAPVDRIRVTGNTKFDAAPSGDSEDECVQLRDMLDLRGEAPIWVAGSTHPGEHEIVLDAYQRLLERFPDLVLVLVPRHVDKTPSIVAAMESRGMAPPFLRTSAGQGESRNGRSVIIVDSTGELFQIYSLASVVFVGGSLVPRGGQNILEPAAWGKVVIFGPSMEDFRDARDILVKAGSAVEVSGTDDLVDAVAAVLADLPEASERGARGRAEMLKNAGSARRDAELLVEQLRRHGRVGHSDQQEPPSN
jgi:3-deoxy-D-manno-octulosonic-acid transferase